MPSITIYHGNDLQRLGEFRTAVAIAEHAEAEAVQRASEPSPNRRGGDDETDGLAEARAAVDAAKEACDAFVDEAAARADEWIIEPIGHEDWRALLKAHPPRMVPKPPVPLTAETVAISDEKVEHEDDTGWGVNTETFGKALLLFVDPEDAEHRTITKAGDADLADLAKRVKRLPHGQFETLWIAAYHLNVGGVIDPKAGRFTPAALRSDAT